MRNTRILLVASGVFCFSLAGLSNAFDNLRNLRKDFIQWQSDILASKQSLGAMLALKVDFNTYRKGTKLADDIVDVNQNERAAALKDLLVPPRHMYEGSEFWANPNEDTEIL